MNVKFRRIAGLFVLGWMSATMGVVGQELMHSVALVVENGNDQAGKKVVTYSEPLSNNFLRSVQSAPDSSMVFNADGSRSEKVVNIYDNNKCLLEQLTYRWNSEGENWAPYSKYENEYDEQNRVIARSNYTWSDAAWSQETKVVYEYEAQKVIDYYYIGSYSTEQALMKMVNTYNEQGQKYLSVGYVWDPESNTWKEGGCEWKNGSSYTIFKGEYAYDEVGNNTFTLEYHYQLDAEEPYWRETNKTTQAFDANGNIIYRKNLNHNEADQWVVNSIAKYAYRYNQDESIAAYQLFISDSENNAPHFSTYTVYYPNDLKQAVEVQPAVSVDESNKGRFGLSFTLPTEANLTGSFIVEFPEGITLDERETKLTDALAEGFDLFVTSQEGNKWLIEIETKGLRSESANTLLKIMDIAYVVDEMLAKGDYQAQLKAVDLTVGDGSTISEESLPVTIEVERQGTDKNKEIVNNSVNTYVFENVLTVYSDYAEQIDIYTLSGQKIHTATKEQGTYSCSITLPAQNILIVKGSSGWERKVICK
ncbi:hypothetical protein [Parabacteroides sp. PF5-9]|uniref:hypothetical protein n=1 Tax=Parabacteroides sp. PF5-9 TaxID=1742404 RepID=UPI0024733191|nr:hypothetical protein [Parabacteroides sp. PF5-9]MDH6356757.1 hypothetical protein [Parabacteroides sp. PF5-9]